MAKKVTLSVPDDLHEKMDKWRSSINFSKVFQKTINSIISTKEGFNKRLNEDADLSSILSRVKKEKEDIEEKYKQIGKKLGLEWSKAAHYSDLIYALKINPTKDPTKDERLGSYFNEIISKDPYLKAKKIIEDKNTDIIKLISGWKESVNEFWHNIKDKL
jgi:gas vesicle protein